MSNDIKVYFDDEHRIFPMTAKGWTKMIDWDQLIGVQHGAALIDGERWEWDDPQADYSGQHSLVEAIQAAIETLLCSKEFVDDKHACDDAYSVFHRIPETLRMRSMLGETPHSFTELVRWASQDVR
jgi:hypothetical protein